MNGKCHFICLVHCSLTNGNIFSCILKRKDKRSEIIEGKESKQILANKGKLHMSTEYTHGVKAKVNVYMYVVVVVVCVIGVVVVGVEMEFHININMKGKNEILNPSIEFFQILSPILCIVYSITIEREIERVEIKIFILHLICVFGYDELDSTLHSWKFQSKMPIKCLFYGKSE